MAFSFELSPVEADPSEFEPTSLARCLDARGVRSPLAADAGDTQLVDALPLNGLVVALHLAYTRHRPLTLTPDAIWLAIAQALARHVEAHAERLRPRLVRHAGKLALETRRDELAFDPGSVAGWSLAVDELAAQVREQLGGRANLFVADFSTTDACSRVASQITLLGAVESYFEYVVWTLCGIPKITLTGTPDDWQAIRARVATFADFELGAWGAALDPVLAQLEATARGEPSREFWQDIYKLHDASGGETISGWVNVLFPYLGDSGAQINPWFRGDADSDDLPKLGSYPTGLTAAPFRWRFADAERAMRLIAGFVGVQRTPDGGVAPAIGWAVAPDAPPRRWLSG